MELSQEVILQIGNSSNTWLYYTSQILFYLLTGIKLLVFPSKRGEEVHITNRGSIGRTYRTFITQSTSIRLMTSCWWVLGRQSWGNIVLREGQISFVIIPQRATWKCRSRTRETAWIHNLQDPQYCVNTSASCILICKQNIYYQ